MTVRVIHSDNAAAMRQLAVGPERFALAYLDPPFFSDREYSTTDGEVAFDDRWLSLDAYLLHVMTRVALAYELLTENGSLVVHVDPTVSHYVKVRGDLLFGRDNFASEIVWRYRRWPVKFRNFQRMHDVLLRWTKGAAPTFNQLYEPLSHSTKATFKQAKQWAVGRDGERGKSRWRSQATDEASPGAALSDVWEVPIIAPGGAERTGYPTQKPEALLERLVLALTNERDSVLDPYLGSGTTLAVCHRLNRSAVGIDASHVAIRYATERLDPLLRQQNLFAGGS